MQTVAVLLIGREQFVEFAQVDDFVKFGLVQFGPDGAAHFRLGYFGPVEALERHRRRRHVLLHHRLDLSAAEQRTARRRRRRRPVEQRRRRRGRRHSVRVQRRRFAVHEVGQTGRRSEFELLDMSFGVIRNAGA